MENKSFSLGIAGIERIYLLQEPASFTIQVGADKYQISNSFAVFLSPTVFSLLKNDPLQNVFKIDVFDENKFFKQIISLAYGKPIEINQKNCYIFYKFALELGIEEMIHFIEAIPQMKIDCDNCIERLLEKYKYSLDYSEIINFIAEHFWEIPENELERLDYEILESILSQPTLKLKSEHQLFHLVCSLVPQKSSYSPLFGFCRFDLLNSIEISHFIELFDYNNMTESIWKAICQRLLQKSELSSLDETKESLEFPYSGQPFNGVFSYLLELYHGNIHQNNIISIKSSGDEDIQRPCWKLIESNWSQYWSSDGKPNSWLLFDFLNYRLNLTFYSLRGRLWGGNYLTSWKMEGSIDGESWVILDKQDNSSTLVGTNRVHVYKVENSESYRYFKITMTNTNSGGSYHFNLAGVEFFGSLSYNSQKSVLKESF